jgi:hypothetical protein
VLFQVNFRRPKLALHAVQKKLALHAVQKKLALHAVHKMSLPVVACPKNVG